MVEISFNELRWLFKDRTKKQCDNITDTKFISFTAVKAIRSRVHSEDFDKISLTPKIISQNSHSAMDIWYDTNSPLSHGGHIVPGDQKRLVLPR